MLPKHSVLNTNSSVLHSSVPLTISRIHLKNFRCFSDLKLTITKPIVLIIAPNGEGKTSILEALYYACYLRSFRTHTTKDLIKFGSKEFFVGVDVENNLYPQDMSHAITIGFAHNKRLVKVDAKSIASYKELLNHYRVISLTEDDMMLIKGSPQERRTFMDQVIMLFDSEFIQEVRAYKQVVEQRNALLDQPNIHMQMYQILTEQLYDKTGSIVKRRQQVLDRLQEEMANLIKVYFQDSFSVKFRYRSKRTLYDNFGMFQEYHPLLFDQESRYKRSMFGAHLDDMEILFLDNLSKPYASRGQQKLIVILVKIAVMRILPESKGGAILLLDDFLTDFDSDKSTILLQMLSNLNNQLIFTAPSGKSSFNDKLKQLGAQIETLNHNDKKDEILCL